LKQRAQSERSERDAKKAALPPQDREYSVEQANGIKTGGHPQP
jgi:hypothetical protein